MRLDTIELSDIPYVEMKDDMTPKIADIIARREDRVASREDSMARSEDPMSNKRKRRKNAWIEHAKKMKPDLRRLMNARVERVTNVCSRRKLTKKVTAADTMDTATRCMADLVEELSGNKVDFQFYKRALGVLSISFEARLHEVS